ncbi:MAG: hypothetical protein AAF226_05240 [Verrucomicrobiota bacterium]
MKQNRFWAVAGMAALLGTHATTAETDPQGSIRARITLPSISCQVTADKHGAEELQIYAREFRSSGEADHKKTHRFPSANHAYLLEEGGLLTGTEWPTIETQPATDSDIQVRKKSQFPSPEILTPALSSGQFVSYFFLIDEEEQKSGNSPDDQLLLVDVNDLSWKPSVQIGNPSFDDAILRSCQEFLREDNIKVPLKDNHQLGFVISLGNDNGTLKSVYFSLLIQDMKVTEVYRTYAQNTHGVFEARATTRTIPPGATEKLSIKGYGATNRVIKNKRSEHTLVLALENLGHHPTEPTEKDEDQNWRTVGLKLDADGYFTNTLEKTDDTYAGKYFNDVYLLDYPPAGFLSVFVESEHFHPELQIGYGDNTEASLPLKTRGEPKPQQELSFTGQGAGTVAIRVTSDKAEATGEYKLRIKLNNNHLSPATDISAGGEGKAAVWVTPNQNGSAPAGGNNQPEASEMTDAPPEPANQTPAENDGNMSASPDSSDAPGATTGATSLRKMIATIRMNSLVMEAKPDDSARYIATLKSGTQSDAAEHAARFPKAVGYGYNLGEGSDKALTGSKWAALPFPKKGDVIETDAPVWEIPLTENEWVLAGVLVQEWRNADPVHGRFTAVTKNSGYNNGAEIFPTAGPLRKHSAAGLVLPDFLSAEQAPFAKHLPDFHLGSAFVIGIGYQNNQLKVATISMSAPGSGIFYESLFKTSSGYNAHSLRQDVPADTPVSFNVLGLGEKSDGATSSDSDRARIKMNITVSLSEQRG